MTAATITVRHTPPLDRVPPVSSTRIAMVALITTELMLFAGLVGTYLVIRLSASVWPPADQPRLPLALTGLNSLALFASLVPMTRSLRALLFAEADRAARLLLWTATLGLVFLAVQGFEWMRLVHHGLTLGSSQYGAAFYLVIGCHALHVLAAVVWLGVVTVLARRGRLERRHYDRLEMLAIYWYFVAALWAVLFPLVYLY